VKGGVTPRQKQKRGKKKKKKQDKKENHLHPHQQKKKDIPYVDLGGFQRERGERRRWPPFGSHDSTGLKKKKGKKKRSLGGGLYRHI